MTINRLNQDVTYLPAFRNLVINGAMQVAQRGTSVTGVTTGTYLVDRWFNIGAGTYGTWTVSQENDGPTGSGFVKSHKVLCTTANASLASNAFKSFEQRIEGQNLQSIRKGTANAQQLTLQFWVKSNVTGTYITRLADIDNSRSVCASYSILSSNTWEKKTIVFPADTTGAFDNDNSLSLVVRWYLDAGTDFTSGTLQTSWASNTNANLAVGQTNLAAATNNYWQVTGVQLEVGAVATPFEFKPIEQELAECQRYYFKTIGATNYVRTGYVGFVGAGSSTQFYASVIPPVTLRDKPTVIDFSTIGYWTGGSLVAITSVGFDTTSNSASSPTIVFTTAGGLTALTPGAVIGNNNSAAYLAVGAEL